MTCFSDLPHPPGTAVCATNQQMLAYLHRYAAHFRLDDRMRSGARVERLERGPAGWRLHITDPNGAVRTESFPRVVVASGRYRRPMMAPAHR
jgi:dimethylaniline monooxygenase (N-oxide forming)